MKAIRRIEIYLDPESHKKLIEKAGDAGFSGRGALSYYINKIANEPICFLDTNVKLLLKMLNLNTS